MANSLGFLPKARKAEEWSFSLLALVKSMNGDLSLLFSGVKADEMEGGEYFATDNENSQSGEKSILETANNFVEKGQKVMTTLCEPTNAMVRLPLKAMLAMTSRCLRVAYDDVKSMASMAELANLLPTVHQVALDVLSQLVVGCQTLLLPWSQRIIDFSLKALLSSKHMEQRDKSLTRACAFRLLALSVQYFGWGRHMERQSRSIVQELLSDTRIQDFTKQTPSTSQNTKDDVTRGRKGKKKKKNKTDSYSDLPLVADANDSENKTLNVEATQSALELSKLILDRTDFLSTENLIRCIIESAVILQREGPVPSSPYSADCCRKGLYSCLLSCATARLGGRNVSKKDAIVHFQMSNSALNLLTCAQHLDSSSEVQSDCREALVTLKAVGSMSRPVVRRVLPDEASDSRDVLELERETERLNEENENLRKSLLDVELKAQGDAKAMSDLKKELESLKKELGRRNGNVTVPSSTMDEIVSHTSTQSPDNDDDDDDDDGGEESGDEEADDSLSENLPDTSEQKNVSIAQKEGSEIPHVRQTEDSQSSKLQKPDLIGLRLKNEKTRTWNVTAPPRKKKRSLTDKAVDSQKEKKMKIDPSPQRKTADESKIQSTINEDSEKSTDLEAMLADFVDAEPDLL